MQFKKTISTLFIVGIILAGFQVNYLEASDQKNHKMPQIKPPAEFDKRKQLAGIWEGTQETPEGKKLMVVEYQVTSARTAVMEKMFPELRKKCSVFIMVIKIN